MDIHEVITAVRPYWGQSDFWERLAAQLDIPGHKVSMAESDLVLFGHLPSSSEDPVGRHQESVLCLLKAVQPGVVIVDPRNVMEASIAHQLAGMLVRTPHAVRSVAFFGDFPDCHVTICPHKGPKKPGGRIHFNLNRDAGAWLHVSPERWQFMQTWLDHWLPQ